jgi:trimethylamine--corrinoid protein Co-methyltransferase
MDTARPGLMILDEKQKQLIHESAVTVLSKTGALVKEPRARDVLDSAGAKVDGERVRIPGDVLDRALRTAPNTFKLYDRDGREAMELGTDSVYFGSHTDTPRIYDFYTGELRGFRLADLDVVIKVCDALPAIDFVAFSGFDDQIPNAKAIPALAMARVMRNTTKPLQIGCYDVDDTDLMLEVAATVRNGLGGLAEKPFFYYYSEPTSPLTHSAPALRRLMRVAELGIPSVYTPMVLSGATGPATLAGAVVLALADSLPGIVLAQTIRPGTPCICGGIPTLMDMKTMICSYGAAEMSLMSAALTEMVRFYGLPMFSTGGCSDSPLVDMQFASEATFSCLAAALSGAHLIHDVGLFYHASRIGPESFVLCDEIINMVRSFLKGIRLDPEALALEVIDQVGPQGHFLTHDHTASNFRRSWQPLLFDRSMHHDPMRDPHLCARLRDRTKHLLETHQPRPLAPEVEAQIAKIEKRLLS